MLLGPILGTDGTSEGNRLRSPGLRKASSVSYRHDPHIARPRELSYYSKWLGRVRVTQAVVVKGLLQHTESSFISCEDTHQRKGSLGAAGLGREDRRGSLLLQGWSPFCNPGAAPPSAQLSTTTLGTRTSCRFSKHYLGLCAAGGLTAIHIRDLLLLS